MFQEFGNEATEFARKVSRASSLRYRGQAGSIERHVNITRRVFSKWSVEIILLVYSLKSARFSDLKQGLKGISPRVLSKKLKDLEELGFIEKRVSAARPPQVRYTLSPRGELLAKLGEPVIIYLRHSVGAERPRP